MSRDDEPHVDAVPDDGPHTMTFRKARSAVTFGTPLATPGAAMMGSDVAQGAKAVLVVDDDPEMRALLRDYLERDGFEVVDSARGEDAMVLVERRTFDAAILDKETPGMSGLELLAFLRRTHPEVPVIVITAFGGGAVAEEAFARGASRYLEKPFRIKDLVAALRTVTAWPGDDTGTS